MFKLEIDTSNDAFKSYGPELARILREAAVYAVKADLSGLNSYEYIIKDRNGNKVGTATLTED